MRNTFCDGQVVAECVVMSRSWSDSVLRGDFREQSVAKKRTSRRLYRRQPVSRLVSWDRQLARVRRVRDTGEVSLRISARVTSVALGKLLERAVQF